LRSLLLAVFLFLGVHGAAAAQTLCSQRDMTAAPTALQRESAYNIIFVRRLGPCASLSFRRSRADYLESVSNLADPTELPVAYTRTMTVGLAYAAQRRSLLAIGVGAGTLPAYLATALPHSTITAVDLDPVVLELARGYFGLRRLEGANLSLREADGRIFLRNTRARYDVIFLDAFRGGYIPEHLTTREFYTLAKSRLARGGVVASNLHFGTAFFDSSVATFRQVFRRVDLYGAEGNVIVIASDDMPSRAVALRRASALTKELDLRYDLMLLMGGGFDMDTPRGARVLTDDFSPANLLEAVKTANRRRP
jgi:spermidine synthase